METELEKLIHELEKPLHKLLCVGDKINIHANLLDKGVDLLLNGIDKIDYKKLNTFIKDISKSPVIKLNGD